MPIPQVIRIDPRDLDKNRAIGISLPFNAGGVFNRTYSTKDQIKSNLINLLLTYKGERIENPEFGADLSRLLFEPLTEDLYPRIQNQIISSVNMYIPEMFKSPKQIDTILKGYTNKAGQTALTTVDVALGKKQPEDILTSSGITNIGVRNISKESKSVNEFYEDRGELMQTLNSIKFNAEEGNPVNLTDLKKYVFGKEM
jgi:phage baseplate assembly protein W